MTCGVYAIINTENGTTYVGSSRSIEIRWEQHFHRLEEGTHANSFWQRAYNLYGDCWMSLILEVCSIEELLFVEQKWINRLRRRGLYNVVMQIIPKETQ